MKTNSMIMNIPIYEGKGLDFIWEENSIISTKIDNDTIVVKANRDGLVSLARHLLTLAQDNVPNNRPIDFDPECGLESGSTSIVFVKDNNLE